ncbi:pentatricopeptide repeat-containing protein At2g33680 [Selaginella moellendorffii]|uniref:pentatricopeptide repeat-containing protein At2g33680 n=1 Tax=Selaginella moellendorffii TaxID=88036 RepID=UPI000D1C9BD1|nr:pentatricopeptide repeat-containing protein At2g33680 [Selaginella moellendorffii]|eukprot:XP_024544757.1 pentatricopeptide repeat-containing protein At2g33680 [Selaginella moellendorffii]
MLGVYSEHEKQQHKAFHLFRRMLLQGLLPERVSFLALLSACRSLDCGKSVEGWILEAGLECDLVVGAALVSMYGRCGSLGDAFQVFQNFENDADMVFWNSMIAACVDAHASSMALELFRRMQLQGVKHNKVTLVSVLSACAKCHNISYGKQLHEHLVVTGIDRDEYLQNALLNLYGVCGSVKDALNVFVNVERSYGSFQDDAAGRLGSFKDLVPALITACGRLQRYKLAAEVFSKADKSDVVVWNSYLAWCDEPVIQYRKMLLEGVAADKVTYISLLQSSRNFHPEELLRVANAGIHALGLVEDVIIATGVLRSYSQCKQVERAVQVFNKMRFAGQDDAVTWTSMLSAYADNGQHEKAVELLHRMQLEGVKPDKSAFVKALNACAACGRLRLGALVHANVEAAGATLNAGVGSALVSLYGSLGKLETGRELFEKLPHKDVFSWTALVSAYSDAGQHEAAVQVFRSMQQFGIQPDAVSILAVLKSSPSSIDATDLRLSLESWSSSCRISIYTEMLSLQGKHGRLDEASFIFDQMEEKDSVAWNAIITTYAQHGHTDKVMEMFQRMQVEGVEADSGTFASITCACSHGGMVREGCSYFAWMLDEFGVARVEQNYASVVDLLGRAGEMEEAERAASCSRVEGMMSNKSMLWKTMLSSCRASSDVKRGVDAASEVLSKQPRNPEAYVLLSTLLHGA